MKFRIKLPNTVYEAIALDTKNGNNLWAETIAKNMRSVQVDFNIREKEDTPPPGHQHIKCHIIFDVKI